MNVSLKMAIFIQRSTGKPMAWSLQNGHFDILKGINSVMPDFTMCTNDSCPRKDRCRRYTEKPSPLQSYAYFELMDDDDCYFYLPILEPRRPKSPSGGPL